jgi:hypothetical protein
VIGNGTMLTIVVHDNLVLNEHGVDGSKPVERYLYVLKILFMETDDNGNTFVVAIQRLPEEPARLLHFTFPMNQSLWVYPSWLHGTDSSDVEG